MRNDRAAILDRLLTGRLQRAVEVEDFLLQAAKGKEPLPDKEKCRQLAYQLGVPAETALALRKVAKGEAS